MVVVFVLVVAFVGGDIAFFASVDLVAIVVVVVLVVFKCCCDCFSGLRYTPSSHVHTFLTISWIYVSDRSPS